MARASAPPVIIVEGLRFACALAVLVHHYLTGFWLAPSPHAGQLLAGIAFHPPGQAWLQYGWIGVELFFVISGMMIARSATDVTAAAFGGRRLLRLLPAAVICATLSLLVLAATLPFDAGLLPGWLRAVTLWPVGPTIDASYWTLGIELSFYLLIAFGLRYGQADRWIDRACIAIGLASGAFWLLALIAGSPVATLAIDRRCELLLLPHGCFFALGMLLARWQDRGVRTYERALGVAMVLTALTEILFHAAQSGNAIGVPFRPVVPMLLFLGGLAALAGAHRAQPALARVIDPGRARAVGMMTYPLYLVHQDAGAALVATLVAAGLPVAAALPVTALVALLTAAAVAFHAEPALRNLLAAATRPRAPAPDTRPSASPPIG